MTGIITILMASLILVYGFSVFEVSEAGTWEPDEYPTDPDPNAAGGGENAFYRVFCSGADFE